MVSRAFKVFLLMILSFGALWAYHYRARDLRMWLELGEPPPPAANDLPGLRSPVDQVLDPRGADRVAAVLCEEAPPPPPPAPAAAPPQELVLADLPTAPVDPPAAPEAPAERREPAPVEPPPAAPRVSMEPEAPPVPIRFREQRAPPSGEAKRPEAKKSDRADPKKPEAKRPEAKKPEGKNAERPREEAPGKRPDPHAAPPDGREPPASHASSSAVAAAPAPEVREARRGVTHVVKAKETLASLARRYYQNDTERWRAIFAANQDRITDPDNLPLGVVLEIPGVEAERTEKKAARPAPGARKLEAAPAGERRASKAETPARGARVSARGDSRSAGQGDLASRRDARKESPE